VQKFSVDGHQMWVIATDYVPVTPYATDMVTLGVGQRTDILIKADQTPGSSWWMRTQLPGQAFCGGLGVPSPVDGSYPQVLASVYYDGADVWSDPTSSSTIPSDISCFNQPLDLTRPDYAVTPAADAYVQDIILSLALNETGSFNFLINNQIYHANFNEPILYEAAAGNTSFPYDPQWNVYDFGSNNSIILNVTNTMPFLHPFHLHGHTFFVLSVGETGQVWDGSVTEPENPMRRDVQIIPPLGYAVIQFETDNPGVW
jgi:FtsP/CotA-like multicopper oxidase with cupredoxin domain